MTCKDTPLRQRGHMEVLQWLLGKQCGMEELARFRMDGEELVGDECSVTQERTQKNKKHVRQ